ncbi:DEAD/DEAH box helicase [Maribacter sp. CXY002]|uniref:DEAD/DEAH box helicase n=1 Tax=Maribacter luteocoastalis TaxID=3407671 RepID=UPI003B67455B
MVFKKLHVDILEALERLHIETPTPFQTSSIPVIKSGANVFCIAPKDSGKTTTLIITTLQKLKCKAEGNAPRAMVIVENKDEVLALYDAFLKFTKYTSLRVYASYDELHIDVQKSEIYLGIDILITTPKTIQKLFLTNGVSVAALKICSVDDAKFLIQQNTFTSLTTTAESIKKCQYVVYADALHPKVKSLQNFFMEGARIVKQ